MGLVYIASGLFFLVNPIFEYNPVLSYILGGCILAYGLMRSYMGYNEAFRKVDKKDSE
jgi:hypothetical protein